MCTGEITLYFSKENARTKLGRKPSEDFISVLYLHSVKMLSQKDCALTSRDKCNFYNYLDTWI